MDIEIFEQWPDREIWVAGKFRTGSDFGYYRGENVGVIEQVGGSIQPKGTFNDVVNDIAFWDNKALIGGSFTATAGWTSNELNRFAGLDVALNLDPRSKGTLGVSPNPMTASTSIQLPALTLEEVIVQLHAADGRLLDAAFSVSGNTIVLYRGSLPAGIYLCNIRSDEVSVGTARIAIAD
jgi:hypothetical protein